MPELFKHREAKELIAYYRQLIEDLKGCLTIHQKYAEQLNIKKQALLQYGIFSKVAVDGLNGNEIDLNNEDIKLFLTMVYICKEYRKISEQANSLYATFGAEIEENVESLRNASGSISWIFSSRTKKDLAEHAYKKLTELQSLNLVSYANELIGGIANIRKKPAIEIIEEFQHNAKPFKDEVQKLDKSVFSGKIAELEAYCSEYLSVESQLKLVEIEIDKKLKDVKKAVEYYLVEELVNTLRGIPVDEIAREKPGIKIKCLKDGGYQTLADVYTASYIEISSVYGISEDASYTIKRICENYADKIKKDIKIKLSLDNKTKAAAKVVKAIYSYIKCGEYEKRIEDLNEKYGKNIKTGVKCFSDLGNGIIWLFLSSKKQETACKNYKYVEQILESVYKPTAKSIADDFAACNEAKEAEAWDSFAASPFLFYKVIEEQCPGVLGTDDSIYGLPEDLARKINEECFFPDGLLCTLRKYQEWGVKYILHQEKVLLGDEMGLGKTIQAIATMVSLKNTGATHFMVVCPASVVTNWCREILKHSKLRVTKIHGTGKAAAVKSWLKTGGVAVTNFESTSYIKLEESFKMTLLIVDEAHYIKNESARRSVNTRNLAALADRVLFMTGTALENNVDEMISLINVLQPEIASNVRSIAFMSSAAQFREKIAPVYYRRKREDVLTELPDKIEIEEWCTLNPEEEVVYEDSVLDKHYQEARRVSWNIDDLSKSSKATRLKQIIDEAETEGRKVLVFSFFRDTIASIYNFLGKRCLNPITGSINVNKRQAVLDEFDKAPAGTVLLSQITAGGTGLNIQSASVVVICEPQLKPSIENQAISRAYRMGQARNVLVYRLLCEDTVDEKLMEVLKEKQEIFDAFADKSVAAQASVDIDETTLGDIIKEEINRINQKRGLVSNADMPAQENDIESKAEASTQESYGYSSNAGEAETAYYLHIMSMDYDGLVRHLINRYGAAKYDYFVNERCITKNRKCSRTSEGLYCHHIDEDKAVMLSNDKFAAMNPFDYQKADRLVYCNLLEHLLLHILIAEEPRNERANPEEIQGIGGAVCYICRQLNDIYNGYEYQQSWMISVANAVKNDYDAYILMLNRLWKVIKANSFLSSIISKEDLAKGYQGIMYPNIRDTLKD